MDFALAKLLTVRAVRVWGETPRYLIIKNISFALFCKDNNADALYFRKLYIAKL